MDHRNKQISCFEFNRLSAQQQMYKYFYKYSCGYSRELVIRRIAGKIEAVSFKGNQFYKYLHVSISKEFRK